MGKPVAMRFYVEGDRDSGDMIRALPVYQNIQSRAQAVLRCPIHASVHDPSNVVTSVTSSVTPDMLPHLVRCMEEDARYDENTRTGRLSVLTKVKPKAPGCQYFTVVYQFMCLGSCPGGLARRPINMVFSLESASGTVLGRQCLEVRICTCPFRDLQQEEAKFKKTTDISYVISTKVRQMIILSHF